MIRTIIEIIATFVVIFFAGYTMRLISDKYPAGDRDRDIGTFTILIMGIYIVVTLNLSLFIQ